MVMTVWYNYCYCKRAVSFLFFWFIVIIVPAVTKACQFLLKTELSLFGKQSFQCAILLAALIRTIVIEMLMLRHRSKQISIPSTGSVTLLECDFSLSSNELCKIK